MTANHVYVIKTEFFGSMDMQDKEEVGGIFLDKNNALEAARNTSAKLKDFNDRYVLSVWKVPVGKVFLEDIFYQNDIEQVFDDTSPCV